jgi:hypothetical protein
VVRGVVRGKKCICIQLKITNNDSKFISVLNHFFKKILNCKRGRQGLYRLVGCGFLPFIRNTQKMKPFYFKTQSYKQKYQIEKSGHFTFDLILYTRKQKKHNIKNILVKTIKDFEQYFCLF